MVNRLSLIWTLSILLYITWGEIPTPTIGPAGSSFAKMAEWSGVDLAAFVDVTSDRRTDAVVLNSTGSKLMALLAPTARDSNAQFGLLDLFSIEEPESLRSIAVADFDGDSQEDYLLVFASGNEYEVQVRFSRTNKTEPVGNFKTQPVVCDANADMIADLYGENATGRQLYLGSATGFKSMEFATSSANLANSNSGFASLGTNVNPSLVLLTDTGIEVVSNLAGQQGQPGNPVIKTILLPNELGGKNLAKFVFGDFNMSSQIQLLAIGCDIRDCSQPVFRLSTLENDADWIDVQVQLNPTGSGTGKWELISVGKPEFSSSQFVGPSLGDADLDGYPDLAVGLKYTNGTTSVTYPAILLNTAHSNNGVVGFKAYLLPGIDPQVGNELKQIAFFDYNEDGILDLFMTYKNTESSDVFTTLYIQKMTREAYFLKVMLTSGLCGSPGTCPNHTLPYGMPGYGYRASYETQGAEGGRIGSSASFVSTSCCGALQLPFVTFGFGDFATYIETVPVSVPAPTGQTRSHALTFIVPNAQVVVIPYQYDTPDSWQAKSFLQPLYDIKVIIIAITLLATCIILLIVIGILQYLEMRSDQKERMQESQRFHFDAM